MPTCDVCGNEYDKAFQVTQAGRTMTFDSFECAIHAMAPTCAHCNCKIIGHGGIAVRIAPITKAAPKTAADAQPRALRPRASASTPFIAGGHVHVDRPKHRSNRPIAERL